MRLPYLNGDDVIARLRAVHRTLKVLAVSAYPKNAPEDVPLLPKPFTRDQLLSSVRAVLDAPPPN